MEKLDVRGRICPFPLFYAKRKLTEMKTGKELEILADDANAKESIRKWSEAHHQEIIKIEDEESYFRIIIKKS